MKMSSIEQSIKNQARKVPVLRKARRQIKHIQMMPDIMNYRALDVAQKSLIAQWKLLDAQSIVLPFEEVGFSTYSEFEEDGILLYLLTLAGTYNRKLVEISTQDGRICMATNLVIHHQFQGFLFEGDAVSAREGNMFFASHPATRCFPPKIHTKWFDRENINLILKECGVPSEIDVLSLDIDGNDLYLWQAMEATSPHILLCEFNNAIPSDQSLTIPYRPDFMFQDLPEEQHLFRSASLRAFVNVSRKKGYRLVGIHSLGFNAFFLRDDVLLDKFPEVPVEIIDDNIYAKYQREKWWPSLSKLPWVEV